MAGGSGRHYHIEIKIILFVSDIRFDAPEPSGLTRLLFISPVLLLDGVVSDQAPQASGVLCLQFAPVLKVSSIPGVHLLPGLCHLNTECNNNCLSQTKRPFSPL